MNGASVGPTTARWAGCVALAAGLHLAWLAIIPGMPGPAAATAPRAPAVSILHGSDGRADVRAVWSPQLFAMPSTRGFSEALLEEQVRFGPPLRGDTPAPFLRLRGDEATAGAPGVPAVDLAALGRAAISAMPLRVPADPAFAALAPQTSVVLYITWTDPTGAVRSVSVDVGAVDPWVDAKPWHAEATLDIDAAGTVRHAFLEQPTATKDRNAALVRILSTLRFEPGPERWSRVAIRYEGRYAGPEASR